MQPVTAAYVPVVKKIKASSLGGVTAILSVDSFPKHKVKKADCKWKGAEANENYHYTKPVDCNYRDIHY